jgi:hypothetical protein
VLASFIRIPSTRKSTWSESDPRMKTDMSEPRAPFANAGTPGTAPSAAAAVVTCSRARSAAEIWSTAEPSVRTSAGVRVATTRKGSSWVSGSAWEKAGPAAAANTARHRTATRAGLNLGIVRISCFIFAMKFSHAARAVAPHG